MNKGQKLNKLHGRWKKDCDCQLKNSVTQPVPGNGNPDAKIVFIGEAPGKKEDEMGIPFVGAAGKFLDEMLEAIYMKRSDVYITNVVKYRPPNNRDPLPQEKEACRQWLIEELNLIDPKLVVFLGRHSLQDFFPGERISQIHGKLLKKKFNYVNCRHFFPLYHPAAALYNGSMREVLLEDFKKLPKVLSKIEKITRNY